MTNFNKNIDYLLNLKLQNFEQEPDGFLMNNILNELDKDHILNKFENTPPAFIFDSVFETISNPNLDVLLAQKLEHYEPIPPAFKPKRKLLPYFYFIILTTLSILSVNIFKTINIEGNSLSKIFSNNLTKVTLNYTHKNSENPIKLLENKNSLKSKVKLKNYTIDLSEKPNNTNVFKLKKSELISSFSPCIEEKINRNRMSLMATNFKNSEIENPKIKLPQFNFEDKYLFFIGLDFGSSIVGSYSQQLDVDFIHKDALKLLKETIGINHVANFAQINLGYEKEKWRHQFGVLYQVSNYSSQFEYYYTSIPIFSNLTGKITTYFERPQHLSPYFNKTIKSNKNMISTQYILSRHLKTFKKWNLWVEVGANLVILNKQKGEVFDFSKGNLKTFEENVKFKLNNTQFITNINFERKISFNNLLKFQIGLQQSSHKLNFYKVPYTQKQIIGQIKTGWVHYF